jgi:hypothetical protein
MRSSPFPDDKPVRLQVVTGSDLAEIFVIDHEFVLVARGVGRLDEKVEPGVYRLKAQLGDTITEKLVVANADQTIDLSDQLQIATPVPLEGTELTHEFHTGLAASESAHVDSRPGSGAEIFLLTRRWSSPTPTEPGEAPLSHLSLHAPDGSPIVDLANSGSRTSPDWDPVAGTTVEVDPGAYLLRWSDRFDTEAEQVLLAVRGWQTQVFLLEQAHGPDAATRHDVSVLMSQRAFDPSNPKLRVVEEARSALGEERRVATEFISESLFGKFENPMLGLFGAHLMLIADEAMQQRTEGESRRPSALKRPQAPVEFDQPSFDEVVSSLRELLGQDHPDVIALSTRASDFTPSRLPPVAGPPMLWRSWRLLVEASNDAPGLVPADVWQRTVATLPMRPFFVWSPAKDEAEMVSEWKGQITRALQETTPPPSAEAQIESPGRESTAPGGSAEEQRRRFSRELLAPRSVIDELVEPPP